MFTYQQSTGEFSRDGLVLATGYSGNGAAINSPEFQNIRMHGPIPQGQYTIQQPTLHEKLGPIAMELLPYSTNQMFLRGDFFIHGAHQNDKHDSSDGCIILDHTARVSIATSVLAGENQLTVIA